MADYWWIVVILIIFWWIRKRRQTAAAVWQIQNRRKQNKEIFVMVIERNTGEREIINLDFVTRIRQYPKKKNGKKKSVVFD